MYHDKLLCYKVCYCLGMSEEFLRMKFADLAALSQEIGYFKDLANTNSYRKLARVYFTTIKHYRKSTPDFVKEVALDPIIPQRDGSTESYLELIATKANALIAAVYSELKPGVDFDTFYKLLQLKSLLPSMLFQVQYLLNQAAPGYNFYFVGIPVLDFNMPTVLDDDTTLIRRIKIANGGRPVLLLSDTSELSIRVQQEEDKAFISTDDLLQRFNRDSIILVEDTLSPIQFLRLVRVLSDSKDSPVSCKETTLLDKLKPYKDSGKQFVVVTRTNLTLLEQLQKEIPDNSMIALVMPVPKNLYNKVIYRTYPNVYLLGMRKVEG